jgi:hypothetical protein
MTEAELVIFIVVAALLAHALALPKARPGDSSSAASKGEDEEPPA